MNTIFSYSDYRKYLSDWFSHMKKTKKTFSYASFAEQAGFSDRGFLNNIIHGRRDLTKESLVKVAQVIGLSRAEADYFENLVFFNKATDLTERNYFYEKMNSVKTSEKSAIDACKTRSDQYAFYANWYHSAIRSVIDMYPFTDDYAWLSKMVYPPITIRQARQSVELLEKLGLIEKQKNGTFRLTCKSITTGPEIVSLAVQNFHREAADMAKTALAVLPISKRNITGLTLGISESTYRKLCEEIALFRSKIIKLAENDPNADRTYQLNFHLYPITRTDISTKEHS